MKRTKVCYSEIINIKNLELAAKFASKGKKKRRAVKFFEQHKDEKLAFLQNLLETETYHPLKYTHKVIQDRCSCKVRDIFVPKFYPDQIVQWALMIKLKPVIMKGMSDSACASIDCRGGSYGIRYVKKWLQHDPKNTKYCLVCDIKKFYPSIDQDILMQKFRKKIKDNQTLNLIEKIVYSVPNGVPIGNFTSQWFANFFLQDFDHFVHEKLKISHYLRYMDDMVFFSSNKRKLHLQYEKINEFLKKENLTLKPNFQIFKVAESKKLGRALDFLGYKFFRNYLSVRKKTLNRASRRIKKVSEKDYLTAKDASAIISYGARLKVASGNIIYLKRIKPFVNMGMCRWAISNHDKKQQVC